MSAPSENADLVMFGVVEADADIRACWPVMRLLRPNLVTEDIFAATVERQRVGGYRLLAGWRSGDAIALAGWRVQENLIHGRHLYVDDLVTRPDIRNQGLGARILGKLAEQGKLEGCGKLVLDTAIDNFAAHRFYARCGLANTALRFTQPLVL